MLRRCTLWEPSRLSLGTMVGVGNVATPIPTVSGRQHVVVAAARGAGSGQTWPDDYNRPGARHRGGHGQATGTSTIGKRLCGRVLV